MKKGFVTMAAGMMMGAMVLGLGGNVFAAGTTMEDAQRTALEAAGVSESQVIFEKKETSFEDGREIFEIDFFIPGEIKYDFDVDIATGKIVAQDQDLWEPEDEFEFAALMKDQAAVDASGEITIEDAQKTALEAAGMSESQVIFKKRGTSFEDGREIFEIDFFIPGEVKYDFDIDVATGKIVDQEQDLWEPEDDLEFAALMKENAAAADVSGEITEEQAKKLALKDAGVSEADVVIINCRKDIDDGIEKFEIEFRTGDGCEYEYDLSASDGSILEKNMDYDD